MTLPLCTRCDAPAACFEPGDEAQHAPRTDSVNHPQHYTTHPSGVECITITEHMSFLLGNAMKYIWRCDAKNGLEDLRKARWYLDREIANRERALVATA